MRGQPVPADMKAREYIRQYKGWVYSCIQAINSEVANIELVLKRRISQDEVEIVPSHPVLDLLYKVNPLYTSYHLWDATEGHIELSGEAFWYLTGPNPKKPEEIWVLRPDWIKINDTKDKMINTFSYGPPGDPQITIPFEQIIPFKDWNPLSPYRGFGGVKAAAEAIDTENSATLYNRMFFRNGSHPGGALETDQNLTDEQTEQIRDEWEKIHRGEENAWRVAILQAGLKWQDIGMSQKDMDYIEGRRFTRDEIFAMFRVPKALVAITDDVNRASARETRAVFLENVIENKMRRIAAQLNEFLLPRYGDKDLFFDYKSPVPNDDSVELLEIDNGLKNGWMTRNEARNKRGLDPIEGGDQLLVPFSLTPIGAEVTPANKAARARRLLAKFNVRIAPIDTQRAIMYKAIQGVEEKAIAFFTKILLKRKGIQEGEIISSKKKDDQPNKITKEVANEQKNELRDMHWKLRSGRTDRQELKMKQVLNEQFDRQKSEVIAALETDFKSFDDKVIKGTRKVKATINDIGNIVEDDNVFIAPLMDLVRSFIEAEGIIEIQKLVDNAVFFMSSDAVQSYLKKDGAKYIKVINQETADQLRSELSQGVTLGESIPELRARVESIYVDATGYRADRIARTETLRATNFATVEAYKQSGVVVAKEWLTAHDERTCPWCGPMDGKIVSLDEDYHKKGDVISGINESGTTVRLTIGVGNVEAPPLHPNCRCTTIPVLEN